MELSEDERLTLLAEQDLLDRVADLATVPGRLERRDVDLALRGVDVRSPVPREPLPRAPVPRPRPGD